MNGVVVQGVTPQRTGVPTARMAGNSGGPWREPRTSWQYPQTDSHTGTEVPPMGIIVPQTPDDKRGLS